MSELSPFSNYSSHDFEQEVLQRFRLLVAILPPECDIHREKWDSTTVLCLDFKHCPYFLEVVKENVSALLQGVSRLGLGNSIIFREGNQLKAWRNLIKY